MSGSPDVPPIALTVDVEGARDRVEKDVDALLELFSLAQARATFFILGEVAERHPGLVRTIVAGSHELGFHGYRHDLLLTLGPSAFAAELLEWIPRLEDLAQVPVRGYRAPSFSIGPATDWALSVIARTSIAFDSSVYPGFHPRYGWRGAPTRPVRLTGTTLKVFPVPLLGRWMPIGFSGGSWLSALPSAVVIRGLADRLAFREVGMVYLHPWQLPEQRAKVRALLDRFGSLLRPMGEALSSLSWLPEWNPGKGRCSGGGTARG